ncbi:hypothetical protein Hdeb2414_s0595g00921731 [Helianthus debilis subsp. tardiflorus]
MSGPECCQNPPAPSSGGESGQLLQIASLNSYVSGNPESKVALILISDVFGNPFTPLAIFFYPSDHLD